MRLLLIASLFCFYSYCSQKIDDPNNLNNQTNSNKSHLIHLSTRNTPNQQIEIPLVSSKWHSLEFNSIPKNQVQFLSNQIHISVKNSASPLIFPIKDQIIDVNNISITGTADHLVQMDLPEKQGIKERDDFNLRLGLVVPGSNTLNWYQKKFSANWIKKMFSLAPEGQGIDHIYFLNAVRSPTLQNQTRIHPLSKYIQEHYAWVMNQPGAFSYKHHFDQPKRTVALWISADGDNTKSEFQIQIQSITINQNNQ